MMRYLGANGQPEYLVVAVRLKSGFRLETREKFEAELTPEEARYAARRAFGSIALAKEDSRAVWGLRTLEILWQDLRYGLRMMLNSTNGKCFSFPDS